MLRFVLSTIICFLFSSASVWAEEVNLALHKAYTLAPRPTYSYCTDPDDPTQLTDGETTTSYFWTQKGTVGWVHATYAVTTIDLGKVESIGRVEFTAAAGVAGVFWPQAIYVQVSDDGKIFREAAELIRDDLELNGRFPEKYGIRTLQSKPMTTKGRFVRFFALPTGDFVFCDEIRVFSGTVPADQIDVTTPIVDEPEKMYKKLRTRLCIEQRYRDDFSEIVRLIENSELTTDAQISLIQRAKAVYEKRTDSIDALPTDFKAILPLEENHAELYKVLASLWKAEGCADVTLAAAEIWDPLERFAIPKNLPKAQISVTAMRNETRSAAFNIYNAAQDVQNVTLDFRTLCDVTDAADVTVRRVLWTDTHVCTPVACALPEVEPAEDGTFVIPVAPGLVQQVWVDFCTKKDSAKDGKKCLRGSILCGGEAVPVELTVYPFDFPEKTTLLLGGWDYTDGAGAYNVNAKNLHSFLNHIQNRHVNAPWARPGVLMKCTVDEDFRVTIDTSEFDAWIENWKPERVQEYFIFLSLGGWSSGTNNTFLGTKVGSDEFKTVVKNWLAAWNEHWAEKGISADRINLLLHDEPNETTKDLAPLLAWIEAIHAAVPELKIWEDPCYRDLAKAPKEFFESCDVLCPNRPMWLAGRKNFDAFYLRQKEEGRTIHLYSCSGPQRLLDPYAYCVLQAWEAARIGAKASFFWAMGDGSGVTSWNEYFLGRNSYCSLFIDPADPLVVAGKHMEAIAASAQDFEYIMLLRARIEAFRTSNPARAQQLEAELNALVEEVLDPQEESDVRADLEWKVSRDRTRADRARIRILELLLSCTMEEK